MSGAGGGKSGGSNPGFGGPQPGSPQIGIGMPPANNGTTPWSPYAANPTTPLANQSQLYDNAPAPGPTPGPTPMPISGGGGKAGKSGPQIPGGLLMFGGQSGGQNANPQGIYNQYSNLMFNPGGLPVQPVSAINNPGGLPGQPTVSNTNLQNPGTVNQYTPGFAPGSTIPVQMATV